MAIFFVDALEKPLVTPVELTPAYIEDGEKVIFTFPESKLNSFVMERMSGSRYIVEALGNGAYHINEGDDSYYMLVCGDRYERMPSPFDWKDQFVHVSEAKAASVRFIEGGKKLLEAYFDLCQKERKNKAKRRIKCSPWEECFS